MPSALARPARLRAVAAGLVLAASAPASAAPGETHDTKAAHVINLASYVTWPSRNAPSSELRVCFGPDRPVPPAAAAWRGRTVNGAAATVRRLDRLDGDALAGCHLAVLAVVAPPAVVRRAAEASGTLLVGDGPGFAARGGHLALVRRHAHDLGFHVNVRAMRAAGLRVSARLLRLADRVIVDADG